MADKDATVRLNLAAAGFLTAMQQLQKQSVEFGKAVENIGGAAEKTSKKTSSFFAAVKAGATGAKSAVAELTGHLKTAIAAGLTLGGSLSIGAAVKEAQEVTSSYKDLAFAIRVGTGAAMSWQDVQQDVEATAARWKRSNKEVAESYADLFQITGDSSFSKKSIDAVAEAATASGKPVKTLSEIAGTLNEKFGITAEQVPKALATTLQLGNRGGASIEELGSKLGNVGASAKLLGMSGQKGLEQILSMLNMADDAIGPPRQKFAALGGLLEGLADPEKMKGIQKALGVQLVDSKGQIKTDALDRILAKTKGQQSELAKVFSGPELKLIGSLGAKFAEGFKDTSGSASTKIAGGLDAFHKALDEGGKVTFDAAKLQEEANGRLGDSERNMQAALNDFTKVFERPEMVHAVNQIAAAAPRLAQAIGGLVEFAADHPILAAAGAVGAVAAGGAAKGAIGSLSERAAGVAGEAMASSFKKAAASAATWGPAGQAFGVAGAAVIGFELGKVLAGFLLDDRLKGKGETAKSLGEAQEAAARAAETGDPKKIAEAHKDLETAIKAGEAKQGGIGGVADKVFGGAASLVDSNYEDPAAKSLRAAKDQLAKLDRPEGDWVGTVASMFAPEKKDLGYGFAPKPGAGAPSSVIPPRTGPSEESKKIAREVTQGGDHRTTIANADVLAAAVARQLGGTTLNVRLAGGGGGSGTNGLPPAAGNGSGSTPR